MKKFMILTIVALFFVVGCRQKTYEAVTVFATDDIIFWDNPSHYDGFEVNLDDSLVDTKEKYIISDKQVEKVIVKPYVKTLRKK